MELDLKTAYFISALAQKIFQVEAEIPDMKIFSDSTQDIFLPGDVKGDTFVDVAYRSQEVFSLFSNNFLLAASVTLILAFLNCQ